MLHVEVAEVWKVSVVFVLLIKYADNIKASICDILVGLPRLGIASS
jgi:hypothetical protein